MDTQPFDYMAARRELDGRVAAFLFFNKEVSMKEAAALFNMTLPRIVYIARKAGLKRRAGAKPARAGAAE